MDISKGTRAMELLEDNADLSEIQFGISHFYYKIKITKKIEETAPSPFTGRYFRGCDTIGSWQLPVEIHRSSTISESFPILSPLCLLFQETRALI